MNKSLFIGILSVTTFLSPISAFADGQWGNDRNAPSGSQQWSNSKNFAGNANRPSMNQGQPVGQQWNSNSSWNHQGQYNNRPNQAWNNNGWNNQNRQGYNSGNYRNNGYAYNRGYSNYGRQVAYRAGDRLPNAYRSSHYYVNDWRGYNLYEPPRGYRWANIDGNFILVALATGIISQILFGGGYGYY